LVSFSGGRVAAFEVADEAVLPDPGGAGDQGELA
jgi:hypothetical protein